MIDPNMPAASAAQLVAAAYAILAEVREGIRPMPQDIADIEAYLPVPVWP